MPIGMGSALVGLPQVAVLRANVALHGLSDDQVANVLELRIVHAVALCAEVGLHSSDAMLLKKLEEGQVLHDRHLDDLSHAVAQPARVKGLPEAAVRDRQHRRMVGASEQASAARDQKMVHLPRNTMLKQPGAKFDEGLMDSFDAGQVSQDFMIHGSPRDRTSSCSRSHCSTLEGTDQHRCRTRWRCTA